MMRINDIKRLDFFLLFLLFFGTLDAFAQNKFTISGIISDSITGETLPYASVYLDETSSGVIANQYGFYSISCEAGNHNIEFSSLTFNSKTLNLIINKDNRLNVELSHKTELIDEVVVTSKRGLDESERKLSSINIKDIKKMPSLLGEPDIIRSIQLLPGVTTTAEVGRGFNVRGGAGDQNLIILDEAIVYNESHLFGAYSVFNPDIIKNVKFYKSGIPANYGGRLSSVMDITQKDGNIKAFHANGAIGLISSRLTIEGPIAKDKASFIVSARKSYVDMFFKYTSDENLVHDVRANFYDLNAKINYIVNENNRVFLSFYSGNDVFKVTDYDQEYGNTTSTLKLNHIYNSKLFSNTSIIYSDYKMFDGESSENWSWNNEIGLKHYEFKHEFIYYTHKNNVEFGIDGIYYNFFPGELNPSDDNSNIEIIKIPVQHAFESAVYLNDLYTINKKLELQVGLRFSAFHYLGAEEIYTYQNGMPRSKNTITDTTSYKKNELIKNYHSLEPRIALRYSINNTTSVKVSYNKTAQYLHLISNTTTPSPYDMWKPSNNNIKPMVCHQLSLGYFTSVFNNSTELSVETFYKKLENTLEVKPGADIVLNRTLDADLMEGKGYAYGFEFMLNKTSGRNKGTISYTYSRSIRKVDDMYSNQNIMPSGFYSSNQDIPHKLILSYLYKVSKRGVFSANFTYMTGRPATLPDGQYAYFGTLLPYYSGKNQHRLAAYHRLDVAYTIIGKKRAYKNWHGDWVFSIYNLYARKNPYSVYIERKPSSKDTQAIQLSIFGSIVPSISYVFSF